MVCTQFLTVTLVFVLKYLGIHASTVYHIKSSTNASCLKEPCLTLLQFAANVEAYLDSNTSLVFLPGHHHLNYQINISTVGNFSMLSSYTSLCCPTVVCEWNAGINFSNIDSVYIGYMRFVGCLGHQANAVKALMLVNMTFMYHSGSAFQFISSKVKIARCSFMFNSGGSHHNVPFGVDSFTTTDLLLIAIFGNSYKYPETGAAIAVTQSSIVLSDCVFEGNQAEIGGAIFVEKFSNITIIDTVFVRNYGTCHLSRCTSSVIYSGNSTIAVFNSTFYGNKLVDNNDLTLLYGGVFGLFKSVFYAEQCIFARNGIVNASIPVPHTKQSAGVIIYANNTILNISNSAFRSNSNASNGGAISVSNAVCIVTKTSFENNSAIDIGGVMTSQNSTVAIYESHFKFNFDENILYGGVFNINYTNITIKKSLFENNTADTGGVMSILSNNNIDIIECNFTRNYARRASVLHVHLLGNHVNVTDSLYIENFAVEDGGVIDTVGTITIKNTRFIRNDGKSGDAVIYSEGVGTILISDCDFIGNTAFVGGALHVIHTNVTINGGIMERNYVLVGLIYAEREAIISINGTTIRNTYTGFNTGGPIVYFSQSTGYLSHLVLIDNGRLIFALFSNITFNKIAIYSSPQLKSTTHEGGGAITVVQSQIVFEGTCFLNKNYAKNGGAIHAIESKIHIYNELSIAHNTAEGYGGGVYLHNSQLICYRRCLLKLINNTAGDEGGGICAFGSYVSVENTGMIFFQGNRAKYAGGAVSLELNSKLYIIVITDITSPPYTLTFTNNSADYGGAVFVADKINSGTCASESYNILSTTTECFIQLLSVQDYFEGRTNYHIVVTVFMDNHAYNSGSNIFGGLLDRCTLSKFSEKLYHQPNIIDGATYFTYISNIDQFESISSEPVRVCFCNEDKQPDCSYHSWPIKVSKGKLFTVSLVAVDHVNNTVPNTTIRTYLLRGGLGENQLIQSTGEGCTDLQFEVYSVYGSEQLILYADGPCKDAPLSQSIIEINFTSCECPIGFQPNIAMNTRCICDCNSNLQPYVSDCDPKAKTITRKGDFWVTYIIESRSYLIHPHCPFDYCKPSNERIKINLNINNGADVQCANNRSGILCGQCSIGTSLSIGSSHCIQCPTYWPLLTVILLIVSVLGGILLVVLILALNLTVAVGTLNGVIFYANIVAANTNSVFPPNIIIAWLNLEPGINMCFFDGMTIYSKTWLQLAFPTYVIFLVTLVISISEISRRFSKLIGKKDPVATLATLLLLSYAKFLHTIIASLSGTILKYDTQDDVVVWLPDATIKYLSAIHIPLFIVAILVLLASIAYTMILFSWQWLLHFKVFNRAQKLSLFIQTYHAPYTSKHRYWTGLLLFARIILYIVFAANVKDDPRINLIAIGVVVVSILIVKDSVEGRGQLYQKRTVEMLEIICHFNLLILCIVSFFALENEAAKNIFAQISMSFTILLLLFILLYHLSTECVIRSKLWKRYNFSRDQFVSETTDTMIVEDSTSNFSVPSCSVIEGPKRPSICTFVKGRKGRRIPTTDGVYELREILLDEDIATID